MGSLDTPRDFFNQVVEPNYLEWKVRQSDTRFAINFAISAYQLREWVFHKYKDKISIKYGISKLEDFTENLKERCPNFAWLQKIANLYKHHTLKNKKQIFDHNNIKYNDGFRCGDRAGMPIGGLLRITTDNFMESFYQIFFDVMAMWYRYFKEIENE